MCVAAEGESDAVGLSVNGNALEVGVLILVDMFVGAALYRLERVFRDSSSVRVFHVPCMNVPLCHSWPCNAARLHGDGVIDGLHGDGASNGLGGKDSHEKKQDRLHFCA